MLIHEAANKTGLPKKTIYYYEGTGLIQPKILANGYRDFSNEDIELLDKIAMLRRMDMSVAEIKQYLAAKTEEERKVILKNFQQKLIAQQTKIAYQIKLCSRLLKEDIDSYLFDTINKRLYPLPKSPLILGKKHSSKSILSHICSIAFIIIIMSIMMLKTPIMNRSGFAGYIIILILSIIIIVCYFIAMQNSYFEFTKDELIMMQTDGGVFEKFKNKQQHIPYDNMLEIEIRWLKDNVMVENWTPVKIYCMIRLQDGSNIIIDNNTYEDFENIPIILSFFEMHNIPIYDPYKIGEALQANKNINHYLYNIYQDEFIEKYQN